MPQAFYILFGAAFTGSTSVALGRILLRRLRLNLHRPEEPAFAFLLGSAMLSLIVFTLAASQVIYKGVFLGVGALALWYGWRRPVLPPLPGAPRKWLWIVLPAFALFSVLYFFHAMAPEMSPDGSTYHLGLVAKYYRDHGFSRITTNIYANLSQGIELLFLFAFAFGKHSAAALTHLSFLAALCWLVYCYGRRFGFPLAGLFAALFVFFSPVVGLDAASAYNDVAVAAILFAVYYLLQIWDETRARSLLVAIGVLGGFAFAAKYTAFVALAYAIFFLLYRRQWRAIVLVGAVAAIWITPWLIKNAVVVGNPVSPFANKLFPNPYVHVYFEEEYAQRMRQYDLPDRWQIPLEVTVRGQALNGLIGPLFLLAPLGLLAFRAKHGVRLLMATLFFGAIYAANIGTRFLIPALPFASLAMAQVFTRFPPLAAVLVMAHAISAWPPITERYCERYAWRLDRILFRQALRLESEDGFLNRKWPAYSVARMIERAVPAGRKVFATNQAGEAYTTREIIVSFQAGFNEVLNKILLTPMIEQFQPIRWIEFDVPEHPVRRVRLVQTASLDGPDQFAIAEFHVFSQGRELPRQPYWRLRANPNPWDVQEAFDNSRLTRWATWRKLAPGQFVEVDFGRDQAVSKVAIEASHDESAIKLKLEWLDSSGKWNSTDQSRELEIAPPLGMRREAVEILKSRGISFLLLHENDFLAPDMENQPDAWGIAKVGDMWGFRLYAIR